MVYFIALVIASAVFLMLGLIAYSTSRTNKYKKLDKSMAGLFNLPIVKVLASKLKPAQNSNKYYKLTNQLSVLSFKVSIEDFYALKIFVAILVVIITLSISITNYRFYRYSTIRDLKDLGISQIGPTQNIANLNLTEESLVEYYTVAESQLDLSDEILKSQELALADISNVIAKSENFDSNKSHTIATIILYKASKIGNMFSIETLSLVLLTLEIGFICPNFILSLYYKSRQKSFNHEVYNLETLTILLGEMETVTVRIMIRELLDNAILFKPLLSEFYKLYTTNRKSAYNFILGSTLNVGFEKLISSLRMCEESSRKASIDMIISKRNNKKEFSKLERENSIERKNLLCLVLYFGVFILLIGIFIAPWTSQITTMSVF